MGAAELERKPCRLTPTGLSAESKHPVGLRGQRSILFSRHTITPRLLQMEREARSLTGYLLSEQPSHAMNFNRWVTILCRNFTPFAYEAAKGARCLQRAYMSLAKANAPEVVTSHS